MNAKEAMKLGRAAMEQVNFHYDLLIAKDTPEQRLIPLDQCDMLHLSVPLDNTLGVVQTAITFEDSYVDIRTFPDPILIDPKDRIRCLSIMELLNYINLYIKQGRCYLDVRSGDIAVWKRIPYWVFEKVPEVLTDAVIAQYEYFEDLGDAIRGCADGSLSTGSAMALIEEKWGWE